MKVGFCTGHPLVEMLGRGRDGLVLSCNCLSALVPPLSDSALLPS